MKAFKDQLEALIDTRHIGATYAVCARQGDPAPILRCEVVFQSLPIEPEWNVVTERHGLIVARGWIDISQLRGAIHENGAVTVDGRTFALSSKTSVVVGASTTRMPAIMPRGLRSS